MRGLGRDYIDIRAARAGDIHTLRGHREALDYLNEQKVSGRIGVVASTTMGVRAAVYFGGIDVIFPTSRVWAYRAARARTWSAR